MRLNQNGWKGFGERYVPIQPISGNKFTRLQIEKHWIDTRNYAETLLLPVTKKEILYQYPS